MKEILSILGLEIIASDAAIKFNVPNTPRKIALVLANLDDVFKPSSLTSFSVMPVSTSLHSTVARGIFLKVHIAASYNT